MLAHPVAFVQADEAELAFAGGTLLERLGRDRGRRHRVGVDPGVRAVEETIGAQRGVLRVGEARARRHEGFDQRRGERAGVLGDRREAVAGHQAAEILAQHEAALVAVPRVEGEGPVEDLVQAGHQLLHTEQLGRGLGPADLVDGLQVGVSPEQALDGEQLVQDRAQREDVRGRGELLVRVGLLGREVLHPGGDGAGRAALGERGRAAGEPEAADHHLAVAGDEDRTGLQAQVEHALGARAAAGPGVQGLEPVAHLDGDVEEDVVRDGALCLPAPREHLVQRDAVDVLLDDVVILAHHDVVHHVDQERVADADEIVRPGVDRGEARRVPEDVGEDAADDDGAAARFVVAPYVALGDAARSELTEESEGADFLRQEQHRDSTRRTEGVPR